MTPRRLFAPLLVALASALAVNTGVSAQRPSPEGVWNARSYQLATGGAHDLRGQIFFTKQSWQVLFFVMEGEEARRGSAEGGSYVLSDEGLVFTHLYNLSTGDEMEGLPESPLRMVARVGEGPQEPTRYEIMDDELVLYFPSGNRMRFQRGS